MKAESLVIVEQHATVNLWPNLVHTARQTMEIGLSKRGWVYNLITNLFIIFLFFNNDIISQLLIDKFLKIKSKTGVKS
jgi:hypothetical protein